jgi:photosystem II stability/assembly factor-like uncharacterized protein
MNEGKGQAEKYGTGASGETRLADSVGSARSGPPRLLFLLPLLTCALLLSTASSKIGRRPAEAEWTPQSSGALSKLSGVFFVDRDHGWVAGSNGTLLVTEDGGANWRRRALPERQKNEALNDVWFLTPDRGLLLGEYGMYNRKGAIDWSERIFLLRSENRGASWEMGALARLPLKPSFQQAVGQQAVGQQAAGQSEDGARRNSGDGVDMLKPGQRPSDPLLLRMAFADERVGWAVGETGTIQCTKDGGVTWKMQEPPVRKLLYDVAAIDGKHAFAVGAGGVILRTVDGGENWREQASGGAQTLRAVHFIDANRGWAVGSEGTIVATTSAGARWQRQPSGVTLNLNDVIFVNEKEGWIAGDRGLLLRTNNGGMTWEEAELPTHANMTRLFFVAPDCGWAVGTSGAIFKYGRAQGPRN